MPPEPGITLSTERVNELRSFMKECHAKYEYRKASAIVMRAGGSGVRDVAATHGVSEKTVLVWTAAYMGEGRRRPEGQEEETCAEFKRHGGREAHSAAAVP